MRLYIIRHADPDYANDTITPAGHLEAEALAKRMAGEGITKIYSSPLGRALATMQYTADALGMEASVQPWMAELRTSIERKPGEKVAAWNVDGEFVRGQPPYPTRDDWQMYAPFNTANTYEVYTELQQASDEFIAHLGYVRKEGRYRIVNGSRDRVAIFCHAGFGLTWLAHLLELPLPLVWTGFSLVPSSVTTILFDERSSSWAVPRCIALGETSHLYEAGLPVSRAGIVANFE